MSNFICDKLRGDIVAGAIDANGRLPGYRTLANHYGCSRGTVENAVNILVAEGLLQTIHGRGTFLVPASSPARRSSQIIGAVLLRHCWMEAMERLRAEYLKDGWFISTYCATDDLQNPASEANFLNHALQQNFAAVILVGTPKVPLNTKLYRKMRQAGMKILHLTHYQYDMTGEAAILPDYRAAGRLAVSTAAMHGGRNLIYAAEPDSVSPSTVLRLEGVREMASGLNLPLIEDRDYREVKPHTVFLPDSISTATELRKAMPQADILALSGTDARAESFDRISFDYDESIRLAMKYACDGKINSAAPYQKILSPKFFKKETRI